MKPNNVHRAIGSGRSGQRVPGDAPSLGKLARAHPVAPKLARQRRTDQTQGRSHEHQSRVDASSRRVIFAWSLLLAGATALVLAGFLLWWFLLRMPAEESFPEAQAQTKVQPLPSALPELVAPTEAESVALVKQALAVRDVAQVEAFFRLGSATPQVVVDFLTAEARVTAAEGGVITYRPVGSVFANGLSLVGVLLVSQRTEKPRTRLAMLIPDTVGKWRVDFDSLAETTTPSWHEILENNAAIAQVRVFTVPDNYYNGPFGDEGQWRCYSMVVPYVKTKLMAYAKIGSPQAAAMAEIHSEPAGVLRVTLEIRRVAGAESRQFEISRVLAQDWVIGPTAFDEKSR